MNRVGHLWALAFDEPGRAAQVRDEITRLGDKHALILTDVAVAVRHPDGVVTLDGEPFVAVRNPGGRTVASFLASLALAVPPLTAATAGAFLSRAGCAVSAAAGISDDFVREVHGLMRPGTSALFVLDQEGDMAAILRGIRGLGGIVLKTNVDPERARLIQSTLAASAGTAEPAGR
jgi:uncharacterized membrane protein